MNSLRRKRAQGFTLIEVMVALAVVAVALPAMITLVMSQLDGSGAIREKTFAFWVAENELTRIRMQQREFPSMKMPEQAKGTVNMGGMQWYWEMESEETESMVEDFYRVDIAVYYGGAQTSDRPGGSVSDIARRNRANKSPMARLAGFISD